METNLCVAGFGGQGVMTLGKFLAEAACESSDRNVTFFPSYGAEQRGGTANCFVVISDQEIGAPLGDRMDDLIIMNEHSLKNVTIVKAPVTELALELGNAKVLNVIMLGVYVGYTGIVDEELVWRIIEQKLGSKPKLLPLNKKAYEEGLALGKKQKQN